MWYRRAQTGGRVAGTPAPQSDKRGDPGGTQACDLRYGYSPRSPNLAMGYGDKSSA